MRYRLPADETLVKVANRLNPGGSKMENAPVIRIVARRYQPEYEERGFKWFLEAYAPLFITVPGYEEIEHYHIFRENPQYNKNLTIYHFENWSEQLKTRSDRRVIDIQKDTAT
jgi:hypothetical protein